MEPKFPRVVAWVGWRSPLIRTRASFPPTTALIAASVRFRLSMSLASESSTVTSSSTSSLKSPGHGLASCPSVGAAAEILNEENANTTATTALGS